MALTGMWEFKFKFESDFRLFRASQNHIFRLLMQIECIEKHIFEGISDYFWPFLSDNLTPLL